VICEHLNKDSMSTKRINEDFLDTVDTSDVTQQDVKVTAEEERITP
jgi:hypothetical protein